MSGSRAAVRYAKAILSFALEQSKEVEVNNDMLMVVTTIEESKELQLVLSSPVLKSDLKKAALKDSLYSFFFMLSYYPFSASAPPTISRISFVIAA